MVVKLGYKQTETGVIPEEWDVHALGVLATMVASGRSTSGAMIGDYPVYGSTGVIGYTSNPEYEGDAILAARVGANAGRLNFVSGRYGVTDNTIILHLNGNCCLAFFWRQLEAKRLNTLVFGSGQPLITGTQLKALALAIPSLAEQEAIAEALVDADALIDSLEQLLTKKRQIKQGAMQELLTGKTRLPGFIGKWAERTFGEIFSFYPTATNSRADLAEDGDTFYVHYGDIHTRFDGHLDFATLKPTLIQRSRCRNAALLRNGDWVMADASEDLDGVGKSIEISGLAKNEKAVAGLHTFLLRENAHTYVPGFKGHLGSCEMLHRQYMRVMTGMKVFGVSKSALRDLVLPVPSSDEQIAIVTILSDMDAEINELEKRLTKTRQIKQGMMQELLTGRIRLI